MVMMMFFRPRHDPARQLAEVTWPVFHARAPSVSIVVPTCGDRSAIERSIRSILAQHDPRVQIIVVDQGPLDETLCVPAGLGASILRISSAPEGGYLGAVAQGFDAATGEYLIQMMPGDTLIPGALESLRRAIHCKPFRVLWFREMEEGPGFEGRPRATAVQNGVSVRSLARGVDPHPCAIAIRRSVYLKAGGINRDLRHAGLQDLWLRLACRTTFTRMHERLGCRGTIRGITDGPDAALRASELQRSVAQLRRRMRLSQRIMCELRHLGARFEDARDRLGSLFARSQAQAESCGEPSPVSTPTLTESRH